MLLPRGVSPALQTVHVCPGPPVLSLFSTFPVLQVNEFNTLLEGDHLFLCGSCKGLEHIRITWCGCKLGLVGGITDGSIRVILVSLSSGQLAQVCVRHSWTNGSEGSGRRALLEAAVRIFKVTGRRQWTSSQHAIAEASWTRRRPKYTTA